LIQRDLLPLLETRPQIMYRTRSGSVQNSSNKRRRYKVSLKKTNTADTPDAVTAVGEGGSSPRTYFPETWLWTLLDMSSVNLSASVRCLSATVYKGIAFIDSLNFVPYSFNCYTE